VAQIFMDNVVKLQGWQTEILLDRDFMSEFWLEFMEKHGVKLLRSTAFNPPLMAKLRP